MSKLDSITLGDLRKQLNDRKFLSVEPTSSLGGALEVLHDRGIRLIPIVDFNENKFFGAVNALDICGFITAHSNSNKEELKNILLHQPIYNVLTFFKTEASMPMYESFPIKLAVQALCGLAHSVPVSNSQGVIIDIITQSDITKFILPDLRGFLGEKAGKSIEELGLVKGKNSIHTIDKNAQIFEVLHLLYEKKLSAVAITNQDGAIIGNFSASDLRSVTPNTINSLYDTIAHLVNLDNQTPVVVAPSASLGTVVQTLVEKKVPRAWVVDENRTPVGVVSHTDIMRELSPSAVRATKH